MDASAPATAPVSLPQPADESRKHAVRMRHQWLSLGLVVCNVGVLAWAVHLGEARWGWWVLWCAVALGSQALFLLAISQRWTAACADPSLTVPQLSLMLVLTASAYLLAGPLRALVVPVMMLVLAFGMFQPPGPVLVRLCAVALVLTWAAIVGDLWLNDRAAEVWINVGHAVFALICFPGIAVLSVRVANIRQRLLKQRQELAEAVARIERLATRDPLTDLFNRRHGVQALKAAWQRQQRHATGMSLVMIDLDHFKPINDRHGHSTGDAVLQCFARALGSTQRAGDVAARWGGEEFLVLLEPIEPGGTRAWLERLQRVWAEQRAAQLPPDVSCTFSAGVARWRAGEAIKACLERADQALYAAKAAGRNRVEGDL